MVGPNGVDLMAGHWAPAHGEALVRLSNGQIIGSIQKTHFSNVLTSYRAKSGIEVKSKQAPQLPLSCGTSRRIFADRNTIGYREYSCLNEDLDWYRLT